MIQQLKFLRRLSGLLFISGIVTSTFNTLRAQDKILMTRDFVYEEVFKTVLLYPALSGNNDELNTPIVPLTQNAPLILEFDELGEGSSNLYLKIIHCNADWTISTLSTVQYLDGYNETFIDDRKSSIGTRIPYTHYKVILPRVKVTGNYLAVVYRSSDESDLILTKRFIVYDSKVSIIPEQKPSTGINQRFTHQQLDFNILYPNMEIINPRGSVKVVIRQNKRWDKIIDDLEPLYIKEDIRKLEYNFFNLENNFPGGNEFRTFSTRSVKFNDINIDKISIQPDFAEVYLKRDVSTNNQAYALYPDIDGQFVVELYETKTKEVEPDYIFTNFTLDTKGLVPGRVFVVGAFNNYELSPESELLFDPETNTYRLKTLLKQGYYNYRYAFLPKGSRVSDEIFFEGSHFATQNVYDFIVYYRPPGARTDMVIGYKSININGRN
jgi:hypothetical protein